jgi:hypothetical protein
MSLRHLLLFPLVALALAACSGPTTTANTTPSAHPSASPVISAAPSPVTIALSTATVKRGGTLTITGTGFSSALTTSVVLVQNGKVTNLVATTVNVQSDGTFTLPVTIPDTLSAGDVFINACSFNPKGAANSQCSRANLIIS